MFSEILAEAWKNDEMFRLLVSGVKDYAIVLMDDEGRIVRWDDGAERIQGYAAEEIIGSSCSRFYTQEDVNAGKPEVELRLARIAGRIHDEGWRVCKNGSRFWASFELTALRDKDGTLTGFAKVIRDITSRKDAEERLRKSEEMFRLLVLGVKDYAIVTLNTDGEVVSWNEGVQRIKGYSAEEILGSHLSRFYTKEDIELAKPQLELEIAAKEGRFEVEGWRVRKDQSVFRAHVVITALHDQMGKLVGFGKVTRDITSQKEAEEALKLAKEQAEQASRYKSEFLANMSHEIRTPMNGIIGITNILLRSPLADQQRQNLVILHDVGISLLSVINDILDFSKVEAGKLVLESQAFEPLALIEGIGDFFAAQARATNVSLMTHIAPGLPDSVYGDAGRLRQVLTNLTSNAIKFSPNGEVIIKVTAADDSANPVRLKFEVIDNGVGIPEEALERIFNPFVQADGANNRKYGGTGLGLSISKRLVELMGGEIGVVSKLGQGATFWFIVPLENKHPGSDKPTLRTKFDDLRIALIDDVNSSRNVIQTYLEEAGVRFSSTSEVKEALSMVRNSSKGGDPYSALLINLSNPSEQLVDEAAELLAAAATAGTEVVLAYGLGDSRNRNEEIDQLFKFKISKPVKRSELFNYLNGLSRRGDVRTDNLHSLAVKAKQIKSRDLLDKTKKVLVAEDNQVNRLVILMELEELGIKATSVNNGLEVLEAIENSPYDIILMDCQMPELDGLQTTKIIRQRESNSKTHIPIVAMTAQALDGDREKCLAAGMDDYISKPIDFNLLEKVLVQWIAKVQPKSGKETDSFEGLNVTILPSQKLIRQNKGSAVDLGYLQNKYGVNRTTKLVELFLESSEKLICTIGESISMKDAAMLKAAAHELSGSCLMLRFDLMLDNSRRLEKLSQTHDWSSAEAAFNSLEESFRTLKIILTPVLNAG